jgi:hypothetical protein
VTVFGIFVMHLSKNADLFQFPTATVVWLEMKTLKNYLLFKRRKLHTFNDRKIIAQFLKTFWLRID